MKVRRKEPIKPKQLNELGDKAKDNLKNVSC